MIKVYITHTGYGLRGPIYRVDHGGEELLASTPTPFFASARALAAKGLSGRFEMWDHERPHPRMFGDIERAAKLTVTEGEAAPKVVKWTPRDYDAVS